MTEAEMIRRWLEAWKQSCPELKRIRLHEARDEDQQVSLMSLEAARSANSMSPPR